MNREDIIRWAQEAGFIVNWQHADVAEIKAQRYERFAELVAAHEREACHALRQTLSNPHKGCQVSAHAYDMAIVAYGAAIRARGEK